MSGLAREKVRKFFECLLSDVMCSSTFYHMEKVSRFSRWLKSLHLDLSPILYKDLQVPLITNGLKSNEISQAI